MSETGRRYRPRRWERRRVTPEGREFFPPRRAREAGRRAQHKGLRHEMRVYRAFLEHQAEWPSWLLNVRHGTEEEDLREGIDFVFETKDAGDLYLQVKSSAFQAIEFLEREAERTEKRWIKVLVVHINDRKSEVYEDAIGRLAWLRLERIRKQGRVVSRTGSEESEAAE